MIRGRIEAELSAIEAAEGIRIFYACESGSRAWGFPSADSDYDVRFLYLHPTDWYLSINVERKRDVVERPIDDRLDLSGWDLRKALRLLQKGNAPLAEWLGSPTIYREHSSIPAQMRAALADHYSPMAALYHYLRMAQGNFRDYLKGPTVWLKKYLYVLRPLLAIQWIEQGLGVVPTEFQTLVDRLVVSPDLKAEIDALLQAKREGAELDRGPRIEAISQFIETELDRLAGKPFGHEYGKPIMMADELNRLFRAALQQVWQE